jgi:hypothetical protein
VDNSLSLCDGVVKCDLLLAKQIHEHCTVNNHPRPSAISTAGDVGFLVPFLFPEHTVPQANDKEGCLLYSTQTRGNDWAFIRQDNYVAVIDCRYRMGEYDKTIGGMLVCGSFSLHGSIIF